MSLGNISHVEKKKSTIADVENCVKCWNNGKYIHSPSEIILSFFQVVVRGLPTVLRHKKTGFLLMRKQSCRSAVQ